MSCGIDNMSCGIDNECMVTHRFTTNSCVDGTDSPKIVVYEIPQ